MQVCPISAFCFTTPFPVAPDTVLNFLFSEDPGWKGPAASCVDRQLMTMFAGAPVWSAYWILAGSFMRTF
jgi:hypothetical protein